MGILGTFPSVGRSMRDVRCGYEHRTARQTPVLHHHPIKPMITVGVALREDGAERLDDPLH
ncbi:hypothetical protein A605_06980 [Corynebacterium halotolerans YIM 70093 = DSM 44683]|uniref:Uncharacterized protein n=1 Tax=Corynebacterium halotolerans YIM 70093 = DSM 44683 TaxID=1121362 RepID=M1NLY9_9CORY|nr:hypothetical protein A605_06980 [Corynebacterium halotolerans YIM 70093 = DSM 44683]